MKTWLETYMFKNMSDRLEKAKSISAWLASHDNFKSHSRHIPRIEVEERQLAVSRLEGDQILQDLALSVFHAATHTFAGTPAVKIVENHTGRAFIKQQIIQPLPAVQLGIAQVTPEDTGPVQNPGLAQ